MICVIRHSGHVIKFETLTLELQEPIYQLESINSNREKGVK